MVVQPYENNSITYKTRYTHIDKYEILDHNSRLVNSGITNIFGWTNGLITHSGITYSFDDDTLFTYKSYFLDKGVYYLASTLLLQTYSGSTERLDPPFIKTSKKYTFRGR